jgi:hypothetical protein
MERLTDKAFLAPQEEIIKRYCAEARELLTRASSKEQALAIRAKICSQLALECDSPLILDATQTYADRLIQSIWKNADTGRPNV